MVIGPFSAVVVLCRRRCRPVPSSLWSCLCRRRRRRPVLSSRIVVTVVVLRRSSRRLGLFSVLSFVYFFELYRPLSYRPPPELRRNRQKTFHHRVEKLPLAVYYCHPETFPLPLVRMRKYWQR